MKNLKASMELLWPHVFVLLLLVAGVIVSLVSFINIRTKIEALYSGSFIDSTAANTANETFEAMQTSVYRAILHNSQDVIDKSITDAKNGMEVIEEQVALIKLNAQEDISISTRLEECLSELAPMQEYVFSLIAQKKNTEAAAYMESNNIPVIQEAQKDLILLIQSADKKKTELMDSLRQTQKISVILLICLGSASLLFSVGVGASILRLQNKGRQNISWPA